VPVATRAGGTGVTRAASAPAAAPVGVHRRVSSTRLYVSEPWMRALAENVWKDYQLETIDDTT